MPVNNLRMRTHLSERERESEKKTVKKQENITLE